MKVTEYKPGTFCWVELATSDGNGATSFYTELFGWSSEDQPIGEDMVYTMLRKSGLDVGALYLMQGEEKAQGIPPHWNSYVAVANADESAAKAKSLGGTVMVEPFDVMDAGRMAVLQDPTGAAFCIWQANKNIGAQVVNDPGAFCWNELTTNDTKKAGDFYINFFGWAAQTDSGTPPYTMFLNGERMAGGMIEIQKEWGEVPPNWVVYFAVENCDVIADRAKAMGGKILNPPTDVPEIGRFSVLQDPQGAVFAIIKLINPTQE